MTTINQDEYMKDRKGRLVPISQISDYDRSGNGQLCPGTGCCGEGQEC